MLPEGIWAQGHCTVLLESANLTAEQRAQMSANPFLPLYLHDDLFELINLGPWIWYCSPQDESLLHELVLQGHVAGLIESMLPPNSLQQQLALGVRVIIPDGNASQLLRFYTPHALPLLIEQHDAPWYGGLFGGIDRWWVYECEDRWRELTLSVSQAKPAPVRLTPTLYQALLGSEDENRLLALWQEGDHIRHFPACERMAMVRKALGKANAAGATEAQKLLWALVWLEGGKAALEELISRK